MDKSKSIQPDVVGDDTPFLFISYSTDDAEEVQKILEILRRNHFRFWYDMGLKTGMEWAEEIGERIEQCTQFLVIITENSIKSKYVRKEINMAVDAKKDGQILVLYLRNQILPYGLKLLLGNLQAISRHEYSDERDFEKAVCNAVSDEILYTVLLEDDNFIENAKKVEDEKDTSLARTIVPVEANAALLSNYIVFHMIGRGAFSEVYMGVHKRTGVSVAIKRGVLNASYRSEVILSAFKNELRVLGKLSNSCPNVPHVMDWFEDNSYVFLVSSFIEGTSLDKKVMNYTETQITETLKKLLIILSNIHKHGIVYRDMKPGNVIENSYGALFLVDFNIARDTKMEADYERAGGTIGYSAPEQFLADKDVHTDFSSDIYALGRLIENLLLRDKFERYGNRIPLRAYRKDISAEFEDIVMKMTEPDRKKRFQSAEEVLRALENYKKIGFGKKYRLYALSRLRVQEYFSEQQRAAQKRKADMQEMAGMTDTSDTILSDSDSTEIL